MIFDLPGVKYSALQCRQLTFACVLRIGLLCYFMKEINVIGHVPCLRFENANQCEGALLSCLDVMYVVLYHYAA